MSSYTNPWTVAHSVDPRNGDLCAAEQLQALDRLTQSLYADHQKDHLAFVGQHNDTSTALVAEATISPYTKYVNVGVLLDVESDGNTIDVTVSSDSYNQQMDCLGGAWHWLGPIRTTTPANDDWCASEVDSDSDTDSVTISLLQDSSDVTIRVVIVREVRQVSSL